MSRVRRILHPTDFSPASNAAFARAVEMARTNKAELLLAHILTSVVPLPADGYVWPQLYADIEASAKAEGQKRLGMLIAKARKAGVRVKALLLGRCRARADHAGRAHEARGSPRAGNARSDRAREVLSRQRGQSRDRERDSPGPHGPRQVATNGVGTNSEDCCDRA